MASDGLWYPPTATPYQGPPPGVGSPTNGMGIAAMVLGIVGVAVGLVWVLASRPSSAACSASCSASSAAAASAKVHVSADPQLAGLILGSSRSARRYGFYVQYRWSTR